MAKRSQEQVLMRRWWVRTAIGLAFISLAYGFASLAFNSGSLLEYAIAIVLVWWAVHNWIKAVRAAFFS